MESKKPMTITLQLEKVSNMVFLSRDDNVIKAWDEDSYTERKLKNFVIKYGEYNHGAIIYIERK